LEFRAKSENELSRLSDDDLVAYASAARDVGQDDQVRKAVGIFVWRREEVLRSLAQLKLGNDQDVEDVVQQTFLDAIKASFRGESPGELFSMTRTILDRRIADLYERRKREGRRVGPDADGNDPLDGVAGPDPIEVTITEDLLETLLEPYSERDRKVIGMKIERVPSKEIATAVIASGVEGGQAMTAANVDQIFRRFKKDNSESLGVSPSGGEGSPR
jgi:DNA-directed RNA polymerase specialized sigma24 family protein